MAKEPGPKDSGTRHHAAPERRSIYGGGTPSVGQSRPYDSGSNAHGRHERPTRYSTPNGHDGGSSITQPSGRPSGGKRR